MSANWTVEAESLPPLPLEQSKEFAEGFRELSQAVEVFIQGKHDVVTLALTCLLSGGHLLLEDVPGVGKTSLARALAAALGVDWRRIQCTPDLLPSDVTGVSVYHQGSGEFVFRPGPVFSNIVLADELNRASPRTQSALLEVMQERTVTVDGEPLVVPDPFLVIATQNPVEMDGTYALPEAQIDRFLIKTSVGYPPVESEIGVLAAHHAGEQVSDIPAISSPEAIQAMMRQAESIYVSPSILDYIVRLVSATRESADLRLGASPRGSIGLLRSTRVHAASQGRNYVSPSDVQHLLAPVLAHRIQLAASFESAGGTPDQVVAQIMGEVPAPQGDASK